MDTPAPTPSVSTTFAVFGFHRSFPVPPSLTSSTDLSHPSQRADRFTTLPSELLRLVFNHVTLDRLDSVNAAEPALLLPISRKLLAFQRSILYRDVQLNSWLQLIGFVDALTTNTALGGHVFALKINPDLRDHEVQQRRKLVEQDSAEKSYPTSMEVDRVETTTIPENFGESLLTALSTMTKTRTLSWVGTPAYPLHRILFTAEFSTSCLPNLQQLRLVFPWNATASPKDFEQLKLHPRLDTLAFILPHLVTTEPASEPYSPNVSLPNIKTITIVGSFSDPTLLNLSSIFDHAETVRWCPTPNDRNLVPFLDRLSPLVRDFTIVQRSLNLIGSDLSSTDRMLPRSITFDSHFNTFKRLQHLTLDSPSFLNPEFWNALPLFRKLETIIFEGAAFPSFKDLHSFLLDSNRSKELNKIVLDQFENCQFGSSLDSSDLVSINRHFATRSTITPLLIHHLEPLPKDWILPFWNADVFGPTDAENLLRLVGELRVRITGSIVDALIVTRVFHSLVQQIDHGIEEPGMILREGESEAQCWTRFGLQYIRNVMGEKGWKLMQQSWFGIPEQDEV